MAIIGIIAIVYFVFGNNDELIASDLLREMEPSIEPVGYFSKPSLFDSETMDAEDWLALIHYTSDFVSQSNPSAGPTTDVTLSDIAGAVVKIVCEDDDYFYYGSGTNVESVGYVVTNFHVIDGASSCIVGFPDPESGLVREIYWAKVIIDDEQETDHDLVILSIEDPVFDEDKNIYGFYDRLTRGNFPYYQETDACLATPPALGDAVFVFGYPSLSGGALTITDGLVSSLYSSDGYIITSAKISSGNSGGLAVDSNGCFVGVPTAVYLEEQEENYGEIIDAAFVYDFYAAVLDDIDEYAEAFGNDSTPGQQIQENSIDGIDGLYLSVPGALRECASTGCPIIRYYSEGARVNQEGVVAPDWYYVSARDDYGNLIFGYMHASIFE